MNLIRAFLTGAAICLVSLSALAQWQWLDKDGRKVFSDRPPPADIPIKNILKQPGGKLKAVETAPDDTAGAPATPKVAASGLRVSGKDKELETKKKQAEDAEATKRKAEEDKNAQAKADNCNRARQGKATYDSGARVARVNASGEREVMDDAARAAETKRMQDMIASNCK